VSKLYVKENKETCLGGLVWFMTFNATFNNISIISGRSVLLLEETGVPGETTDLSQVTVKHFYTLP
jgi:hypothetical protein